MCLLTALAQGLKFCLDRYFIKQVADKKLLPSQLKQPECLNFYLYTRYNVAWKIHIAFYYIGPVYELYSL